MPHVNIWIRKEDFTDWEKIKDKPGFIHRAIQGTNLSADETVEIQKMNKKIRPAKAPQEKPPMEQKPDRDLVTVDDKKLKSLFEEKKVHGDHCMHGYNLKVSQCKFGCTK